MPSFGAASSISSNRSQPTKIRTSAEARLRLETRQAGSDWGWRRAAIAGLNNDAIEPHQASTAVPSRCANKLNKLEKRQQYADGIHSPLRYRLHPRRHPPLGRDRD